ncbi:MAG: hypothetical protein NZM43_03095 [Saprospiraceae bacterium]|nr:hypothetical protein [Saprospiraceae bacterium]MDW8483290.1 hypothetical protein [Saprospiraceae bacterium]
MQRPFLPVLVLLSLVLFARCGKENPNPESSDLWVVAKFVDLKPGPDQVFNDDTQRFAGYSFEFRSGDLLVIHQPGGNLKEGKWRLHTNDTKLSISMENPPALLEEIVGTWNVEQYSASSIKLVNPSNPTPGILVDYSKQAVRIEFVKQ